MIKNYFKSQILIINRYVIFLLQKSHYLKKDMQKSSYLMIYYKLLLCNTYAVVFGCVIP